MVNRPLVTRRAFVAEIDQVFRRWKRNLLFTIAFWLRTGGVTTDFIFADDNHQPHHYGW